MFESAKEWAMLLNVRILNNDLYRSEYAKVLVGMNHDIQLMIINLLNEIIADNPKDLRGLPMRFLVNYKE